MRTHISYILQWDTMFWTPDRIFPNRPLQVRALWPAGYPVFLEVVGSGATGLCIPGDASAHVRTTRSTHSDKAAAPLLRKHA